jgi:hypothetical protein
MERAVALAGREADDVAAAQSVRGDPTAHRLRGVGRRPPDRAAASAPCATPRAAGRRTRQRSRRRERPHHPPSAR